MTHITIKAHTVNLTVASTSTSTETGDDFPFMPNDLLFSTVEYTTPRWVKIDANGNHLPADSTRTDHVALLFPDTGWMVAVAPLAREGGAAYASQADVEAAAKALRLLGHDDWILAPDTVYDRHVIDRRFHKPAADPKRYPHLLRGNWYWTSTAAPWSSAAAFYVDLDYGYVGYYPRDGSGFGLACRRARQ